MNFRANLSRYSLAVALIAYASSAAGAQTRIYFARRATRAIVRGYLRGINGEALYLLRAKAGQHMRVEIRGRGATRGVVTFPSGGQDGSPGGVVFDGIIPDTGDYRIRVTESSMAEAWRGSFMLIVDVTSEGGDWLTLSETPTSRRTLLSQPRVRESRLALILSTSIFVTHVAVFV
jgi:hypothetical protein